MSEGAKNLFEKLSSTFNKDMPFNDENEITVERCVKFRDTVTLLKGSSYVKLGIRDMLFAGIVALKMRAFCARSYVINLAANISGTPMI